MADVPLHWLTALVLLAFVPTAVYLAKNPDPVVVLTFLNVALIAGLLYRCFIPEKRASTGHA
ncbi:hypothetical protein [Halarchaeum nitratireducens]|uniref:DUF8131 domain-containing protein n=1 Tax=Halarchaeum nitratireducens TaxID=489913 RepID=A0A830GEU2_9EURY|nr:MULTISPECIES: hypothetical protein [Halarchaeum]MBP2251054.1 hypothetical protein [Halarchaeum solikamskense]GGN21914.1 hypothetical protein GCM10009021_24150 [Halarchaeum nitratireducens]